MNSVQKADFENVNKASLQKIEKQSDDEIKTAEEKAAQEEF